MSTDDEELRAVATTFRALAHPTRIRALVAFRGADRSPTELERLLADPALPLGLLSYHVRGLARAGLVELESTIPRRGALEHRYAVTARGRAVLALLEAFELP